MKHESSQTFQIVIVKYSLYSFFRQYALMPDTSISFGKFSGGGPSYPQWGFAVTCPPTFQIKTTSLVVSTEQAEF